MCPQMGVMIGPGSRCFTTNTTLVRLVPSMNFHMISEIIRSRKSLVAVGTSILALPTVFRHMSLLVGFVAELQATFIADKGFDSPVRSHVRIQLGFPQISFGA